MSQTVELPDVLDSALETTLRGLWTAMPGRIERYDPITQSANIQLTVQSGYITEGGERAVETIAVLNGVPCIHIGGGGFRVVSPVAPGDTALVVFVSRSLALWLKQGGVVDPGTEQHHNLSDAVAIVGLRDHPHALANAPTDRMSIGKDNGPSIEITSSEVKLGGNDGTQPTIRGTTYRTAEDAVLDTFATTFFDALELFLGQIKSVVDPFDTFTIPLLAAITATKGAITSFTNNGATYLSTIAKVL